MIATAQDKVILCVEDEQDLLSDMMEELAEAGYQAIGAKSGSEALEKLTESPPDLILCDISMPGLTGFDVLKAVREKGDLYAHIPFVFLTALSDPQQVVEGKRLGADDYLVKPIDYDLLLATLEARLRQVSRIHSAQITPEALQQRYQLTEAESHVALALCQGKTQKQIAEEKGVSITTVAFHARNIYSKTHTNLQAELTAVLLNLQ